MAIVHGGDITTGGGRSAVEFLIKMISRRYGVKKQEMGEDADFEKSGRILKRVIEWFLTATQSMQTRDLSGRY